MSSPAESIGDKEKGASLHYEQVGVMPVAQGIVKDPVAEIKAENVAFAAAVLAEKPKPWSPNMIALYAVCALAYLSKYAVSQWFAG